MNLLLRSVALVVALLVASPVQAVSDTPFEAAFRKSILQSFDEATGKILQLAEAIPDRNYGWRPMEKVNSVREILLHVTTTHYALAAKLGVRSQVDRKELAAAFSTKAEAIEATRKSIQFMRGVVAQVSSESLLPETNVFGEKMPTLRVCLLPVDHAHEHLGQLIAYARMNQIVPPWSQ